MQTVSFSTSSVSRDELSHILSDYLALDRARMLRRLMVMRFGLMALAAASLETLIRGFSPFVRAFSVALCLIPPAWAWVVELARERRLVRHRRFLDGARAASESHKKFISTALQAISKPVSARIIEPGQIRFAKAKRYGGPTRT